VLRGLGKLAHDLAKFELARRSGNRLQSFEENCLPEPFVFYFLPIASGLSTLIGLPAAKARI
jgi:hypothetical protein